MDWLILLLFMPCVIDQSFSRSSKHHHKIKDITKQTSLAPATWPTSTTTPDVRTPEQTTTLTLTLENGEATQTTNSSSHLRSALDVLAPELNSKDEQEHIVPGSLSNEIGVFPSSKNASKKGKNKDVVLEVIEVDPFSLVNSKHNIRFIAIISLYVSTGLISIIATYCVLKIIIKKKKRRNQYMLLTKQDMEYHRGGGGI